ncbi:50S ribosomal protein L25 [Saprospira sp. CCB-QB6]|uniref:50S ribosomal protein L25 n=1 Tax=Saprospira sp. CCB-QB6 TaxID=3023936 RepID=UPI00234A10F3|nr:50S ribosomal protein L25 [Saprospira sp. CCB-QB6]WCL82182.1 50S ribosomal protein L25 [Saprospira sp. CCB-QB6]
MKTIEFEGQLRSNLGKSSSRELRKEGRIPCVVYGNGENLHFTTTALEIRDLIYTNELRKASIKLGEKTVEAIIKEVQFHPVTDKILHIDFQAVVAGQTLKTEIPIRLVGNSKGQKVGGTLVQKMRKLKVLIQPESLCAYIAADVTPLDLGKSMRVRDIQIAEGIEIMTNGSIPVASIEIPRALRSAQSKAAAEAKK